MATENLICFQVLILFVFPLRTADSATFSLHTQTQVKGIISKSFIVTCVKITILITLKSKVIISKVSQFEIISINPNVADAIYR